MLKKHDASYMVRRSAEITRGPKFQNSRTLRRYLADVVTTPASGKAMLTMCLAFNEGYNAQQLQAIYAYAKQLAVTMDAYASAQDMSLVKPLGVSLDLECGSVLINYELEASLESGSLMELQDLTLFVSSMAYAMVPFAKNPALTAGFDDYQYRGYPCSIVDDDQLWAVSGHDLRGGGSGVLEWCHSEADATAVMQEMLNYPCRFVELSAEKWRSLN